MNSYLIVMYLIDLNVFYEEMVFKTEMLGSLKS